MEYSFFRAEGSSLDAIGVVEQAQAKLKAMHVSLARLYDAGRFLGGFDRVTGKLMAGYCLTFKLPQDVPEGWESQTQMSDDGQHIVCIFANPVAGSQADKSILNAAQAIEEDVKKAYLEDVFGCGDMPMKDLPAGEYSWAFVRDKSFINLKSDTVLGMLVDRTVFCYGSNNPLKASDPIAYMKIDGAWYIRVPNDPAGNPRFSPPDAVPVSYDEMLKIDWREYQAQQQTRRCGPSPAP